MDKNIWSAIVSHNEAIALDRSNHLTLPLGIPVPIMNLAYQRSIDAAVPTPQTVRGCRLRLISLGDAIFRRTNNVRP